MIRTMSGDNAHTPYVLANKDAAADLCEAEVQMQRDGRLDEEFMPLVDDMYPPGVTVPPRQWLGPPYCKNDFRRAFNYLANGESLDTLCLFDKTLPPSGTFMRYVRKHPDLWAEYKELMAGWTHLMAQRGQDVAAGKNPDGTPSLEETQRTQQRLGWSKTLMTAYDRDVWGDQKKIDLTHAIDLSGAMQAAEQRYMELQAENDYIEHDPDG